MRIGHALNVLVHFSEKLFKVVRKKGIQGFIAFVGETIRASLLDVRWVEQRLSAPIQLRLV
jgi:hypothetical protein